MKTSESLKHSITIGKEVNAVGNVSTYAHIDHPTFVDQFSMTGHVLIVWARMLVHELH